VKKLNFFKFIFAQFFLRALEFINLQLLPTPKSARGLIESTPLFVKNMTRTGWCCKKIWLPKSRFRGAFGIVFAVEATARISKLDSF
jgi:hypothetical protein